MLHLRSAEHYRWPQVCQCSNIIKEANSGNERNSNSDLFMALIKKKED